MYIENERPLISIIILNWNGKKYLNKCLEALERQDYSNYEVVFVDNNSNDDSLIETKKKYPNFFYIENKKNYGFAKGMNIGISYAKGKYVLLLNTDVYLDSNYLTECLKTFEKSIHIGCVAGIEYIWENNVLTDDKAFPGAYGIKLHLQISQTSQIEGAVFGVSGSFPVFKRTLIDQIISLTGSFFDEDFETGWEDTDIRFLMIILGWKTYCATGTKAWHVGSAAANEQKRLWDKSYDYQVRIFRNRLFIQKKYITSVFYIWDLYIKIINFLMPIFLLFFHISSLKAYFKGYSEYRKKIPVMNLKKQKIRVLLTKNKSEILKYLI